MSWKEEIKKFKGRFPDDNHKALEVFERLTDENWQTNLTFNDIGLLTRYLDDYVETRLPEGDDDKLMEIKELVREIDELENLLESYLIDTRELLLDLGM
tara:strand:+ start:1125 stop:1421 length:297 start_codon:yes stop_codon:yes gene_type:complete